MEKASQAVSQPESVSSALLYEGKTRFEVAGHEMIKKTVAKSGGSGRVYLPLDWLGKRVMVIRVD